MSNLSDQPGQLPPLGDETAQGQHVTGGPSPLGHISDIGDDELPVELDLVDAMLRQDSLVWAADLPSATRVTSYAGSLPATEARSQVSSSVEIPASAPNRVAAPPHHLSRFKRLALGAGLYAAVLVLVIAAFAVFHLGAGSRPASAGGTSTAITTEPETQQIFRYPLITGSNDIATLDPALVTDPASAVPVRLIFPGLLTLDANGLVIPWAAAMPTFDTASDSYTFQIQPDLEWSDGTPIDANTFAYSLNRSLSPCTGSPDAYYLFPIKDAQAFSSETCAADGQTVQGNIPSLIGDSLLVPNPQTLVIQLSAPAPYFLDVLTTPIAFAQPQQLISQYGNTNWTDHLTDNGGFGGNLYEVQLWNHHGSLELTRNPRFWGSEPGLSEVDFRIYPSTQAEYTDYLDGRLDLGFPPADQYQASSKRSDFSAMPLLAIDYFQPNWAVAPFNDVQVRQAFDLALNKAVLADQVLQGSVTPTNHIVPAGMPGYDPQLVGPDGSQNLTANVPIATSLMQSYANADCGGQMSRCPPVTLVDSNDPQVEAVDQAAVAMWQASFPGYPIHVRFMNDSAFTSLIQNGPEPQIFGMEKLGDYPDPQYWLSLQFSPGAPDNVGSVDLPAANTIMAEADQDLSSNPLDNGLILYNEAEQLLVTNGAWIPLGQQALSYNLPSYVQGFQFNSLGQVPLTSWQQINLAS